MTSPVPGRKVTYALVRPAPINVTDFMDVITTHINADFDCLGSMIAAKRLYP